MENVGIRYGRGPEILSNINLSLERGSFHYLTGKSGAGKTSLLSMMYLAQKPSRGNVSVFGNNVNFANRNSLAMFRRRIGVVFQDFRLLEHSSAFDNVALPLRVCGMNEKEIRKRVNELLKWGEIDRSPSAITSTLSGGEKQRVILARAIVQQPELLILDEPTNHLDIKFQFEVLDLVKDLNISTLCVLHNIELSARYCDYLYAMKQGRIVAEGAPNKLITKETIRTIYDVESEIYTNPITQDLAVAFLPTRYR